MVEHNLELQFNMDDSGENDKDERECAIPFGNRPRGCWQHKYCSAQCLQCYKGTDKKANLVRKIRSSRKAQWSASATLMQAIKGTFSLP